MNVFTLRLPMGLWVAAELSGTYKVRTCNNGNDAWQIVLAEKPELVISDVIMPGMDGYSLLKQIKKNTVVNHIPIILLTSKTEAEDRIKGIKYGADAYLNKPFNIDELKAVVGNLLDAARRLKSKFSGAMEQEDKVDKIEMKLKNDGYENQANFATLFKKQFGVAPSKYADER